MARFEGSLARTLDLDDSTAPAESGAPGHRPRPAAGGGVASLDKYRTLEHRRRQAQIRARRLLAGRD